MCGLMHTRIESCWADGFDGLDGWVDFMDRLVAVHGDWNH